MFSQEMISRVKTTIKSAIPAEFAHKRAKGRTGEDVACIFLERNGFKILVRNYQKKWGELDIVASKDGVLDFFEVKSVTAVCPLRFFDSHRPEDNVHSLKVRHIRRMIETYLAERGRKDHGQDQEFRFHVLCVYMDLETRKARVKWIKDVIL
jgi:putative endonuclease